MNTSIKTPKKKSPLGAVLQIVVPLAVTVGLCWLMFRNIDFHEMMQIIRRQCNFGWIALGMALSVLAMVFRAMRWRIQLIALGVRVPRHVLVYSIFGTYAINLLVPRLGEVWRSGYIAQRQDAKFSTVFGSMLSERFSDTVVVFIFLVAAFLCSTSAIESYAHQNGDSFERVVHLLTSPWLWVAALLCLAALVVIYRLRVKPASLIGRIQTFLHGIWQGFASIATMRGKGRWLGYTVLLWGCYFVQLWVAFYAFPFTEGVIDKYGLSAVLVTYAISSMAMGVPSNGGIGPWQFAVIFALDIYGVASTDAGAFANLVLGCNTGMVIALGIYTFIAVMVDKRKNSSLTEGMSKK